jgi:hypothetical protein
LNIRTVCFKAVFGAFDFEKWDQTGASNANAQHLLRNNHPNEVRRSSAAAFHLLAKTIHLAFEQRILTEHSVHKIGRKISVF